MDKLTIWIFFIICCIGGCAVTCSNRRIYKGERSSIGVITESGTWGVIWKTYELELSKGFTKGGTGTVNVGNADYCMIDNNVIQQASIAKESGKPVKITFVDYAYVPPWECGPAKIAVKIDPIN